MQARVNAQNNADRRRPNGHIIRPSQKSRGPMPILLLLCLLVLMGHGKSHAQMSHPMDAPVLSNAQKAFDKMKTLAGSWKGTIMGMTINGTLRVTSSGNAILYEVTSSARPDDPITMFYLDGERLLATHYCDAGNRPRMEGKMSPDGKTFEFTLIDIAGSTQKGYMNHMVFTITDADHHTEESTWSLPGDKQFQVRGELTRMK